MSKDNLYRIIIIFNGVIWGLVAIVGYGDTILLTTILKISASLVAALCISEALT